MKEIAKRLRQLIIEIYPDVVEVPWPKQRIIGYGVGPKKMSEHYAYVGPHKEHVNLGFYYGSTLADPHRRLEGTGKRLRHVKIWRVADADSSPIRNLLSEAIAERKSHSG